MNENKFVNAVFQVEQLVGRFSRSPTRQRQVVTRALADLIATLPFEEHPSFIAAVVSELVLFSQIRTIEDNDIERDIDRLDELEEDLAAASLALIKPSGEA
jgi:hypothetical protein